MIYLIEKDIDELSLVNLDPQSESVAVFDNPFET
jgi:hypothetical protein